MSYTVTVLDAHTEHGHGVYSFPTIGSVWCKGMSLCGLLRHSIRAFSDWLHVVAAIIWSSRGWASSLIRLFVIWDSTGCILVLFLYKSKVAVLKLNHRPVSTTSNINGGTCLYLERNRFAIPSDLSVSWHIATQIELKTPADEWSQTQSQSLKQHFQRQHCNFSGHGCSNFCFALVSKYCSIKGLW